MLSVERDLLSPDLTLGAQVICSQRASMVFTPQHLGMALVAFADMSQLLEFVCWLKAAGFCVHSSMVSSVRRHLYH